jgi:beta-glucosidase-like glycosyl hydrolase/CubicO group peptidase (beta-lactamase class C family)
MKMNYLLKMLRKTTVTFLLPLICFIVLANTHLLNKYQVEEQKKEHWVDSVFNAMSPEQRLGQLFMIAAYSNGKESDYQDIDKLVRDYNLGGLIFMQGGPMRQAALTNRYQSLAKIPLLISMDAEWGLSMRLDSTLQFPRQMTLGAIQNDDLIFKMGKEMANQCKRMGVHISFSPAVDVNSNPMNPVIGIRSFGENKEKVAAKGSAYMRGLQANGVIAVAKHFPGHGDTDADSHLSLPEIKHSKKRIDEIELYPFKRLIKDSVAGVMVAHIHVPAFDDDENKASSLSKEVVKKLLIDKLDYTGLVFTDALNMKGVSKFYKPGEIEVMALKAGNDVLLFSENVPLAIESIKKAIENDDLEQKDVDAKVRKILGAKYWAKLHEYKPIDLHNLYKDLYPHSAVALRHQLFEKAITVVKNETGLLPIKHQDTLKLASIAFGVGKDNEFQHILSKYAHFEHYHYAEHAHFTQEQLSIQAEKLAGKTVIISIHGMNNTPSKGYGVTHEIQQLAQKLQEKSNVIVVVMGNAYALKYFEDIKHVICTYENNDVTRKSVPQVIFGAMKAEGKLPVSPTIILKEGMGYNISPLNKLQYSIPERVGMNSRTLNKIDTIVGKAIKNKVMPGCKILVAREGKVIFERNYGTLNYDTLAPVTDSTIYDIASISKVVGTLQCIMFLKEQGLIHIDSTASTYLPELKGTNKQYITLREALTHTAGLQAFIEHFKKTTTSAGKLNDEYYCNEKDSSNFTLSVTNHLFAIHTLPDSMWKWSINSELIHKQKAGDTSCYPYRYSDISFYILKRVAEKVLQQPISEFLAHHYYQPLGMYQTTYNPLDHNYPSHHIAPTEYDGTFRKQVIRGTVHDPGAAMMGGVAGHAGVFSTTRDLAILMQMHLQNGNYGGYIYLRPETVVEFTKASYTNCRRGLGWDKPQFGGSSPTSDFCSFDTFGHTGFTGTCAWADPKYNLQFIFLSNRTFPNSENKKLITQNIRTRIQDEIYRSMTELQLITEE